jgi:S1-C subfamily serine protease
VVPKAERSRLNIENGVRITKVYGGVVRQMRIDEGFIVTSINNRPISTPEELADILAKVRGQVVIRGVNRQGQKDYYVFNFY